MSRCGDPGSGLSILAWQGVVCTEAENNNKYLEAIHEN